MLNWPYVDVCEQLLDGCHQKCFSHSFIRSAFRETRHEGNLFLPNLMTPWYQSSVSKPGQLPRLVGQLTSGISTSPTTAPLCFFIMPLPPRTCADPTFQSAACLNCLENYHLCQGKKKAGLKFCLNLFHPNSVMTLSKAQSAELEEMCVNCLSLGSSLHHLCPLVTLGRCKRNCIALLLINLIKTTFAWIIQRKEGWWV